ncbi:VWA domain-containing protein [Leptolyngbya sp. FACHB-261]|uniref:VWA domain-containing protein n=1 Tax=Leptolyngbya sp. FACHB-261 TaxID=2692806 RepID=UPI00168256B0|nr:VWA domain-containing protein [Leptolyngbya sp. FACHB-261]MBD2102227.1 VWA domain-containing protein [Leptolyngbya sp. FACHB-261]
MVSRFFESLSRAFTGSLASPEFAAPQPSNPATICEFTNFRVGRHNKDANTVTVNFRFADHVGRVAMPNLDVVILLDVSASMREQYQQGEMQALFEAVLRYLLPFDADGITVILFAGQDAHYIWPEPVRNLRQIPAIMQVALQKMVKATYVAPALETALSLKKPNGSVLVEILTDGAFEDREATVELIGRAVQQLVAQNRTAQPSLGLPLQVGRTRLAQSRQYHIHITGLGLSPDSRRSLENLDDNLELPFDIVDFSTAQSVLSAPDQIFQELDRSALTVGNNGLVTVRGPASIVGVGDGIKRIYETEDIEPDLECEGQVIANFYGWEKMPAAGQVAVRFAERPEPFELTLSWQGEQTSVAVVPR